MRVLAGCLIAASMILAGGCAHETVDKGPKGTGNAQTEFPTQEQRTGDMRGTPTR